MSIVTTILLLHTERTNYEAAEWYSSLNWEGNIDINNGATPSQQDDDFI